MEETAKKISEINWKEIGVTFGLVVVGGTIATIAGMFAYEGIKSSIASSKSKKKDDSKGGA